MSATVGRFQKTPIERKQYTIDYSRWLEIAEQIDSFAFSIEPATETELEVTSAAIAVDGKSLSYFILGGEDGEQYEVHVIITSTINQIKEVMQIMRVQNL